MKLTYGGSDPDRDRQAMYNSIYEEVYKEAAFELLLSLDVAAEAREGKEAAVYSTSLYLASKFYAQVCDDEEWESGILAPYVDRFR